MAETKYTFWEWLGVSSLGSLMIAVVFLVYIPVGLLASWMRAKIWEWFMVPYFHAPHIGVWLMFAAGLFWGMFQPSHPDLKKEYYSAGANARLFGPVIGQLFGFGLAYLLHITVLKG